MTNHLITIQEISGDVVQAEPNPFPDEKKAGVTLKPGDTVTWILPPNRRMRVKFEEVHHLPIQGDPQPFDDPRGPFASLVAENGRIVGTVRDDLPRGAGNQRFYYTLLEEGRNLEWKKKPEGAPSHRLGGGIDIKKPPGSGGGG